MGALMKLQAAGITVYQATRPTVGEAITAFQSDGPPSPEGDEGGASERDQEADSRRRPSVGTAAAADGAAGPPRRAASSL